jgi:hypothetical protein
MSFQSRLIEMVNSSSMLMRVLRVARSIDSLSGTLALGRADIGLAVVRTRCTAGCPHRALGAGACAARSWWAIAIVPSRPSV